MNEPERVLLAVGLLSEALLAPKKLHAAERYDHPDQTSRQVSNSLSRLWQTY